MLKSMNFNLKIRSLQVINHITLVIALIYATNEQHHLWWVTGIAYMFMSIFGGGIGLHRLLAHRSYRVNKWWEYAMSLCSVPATIGSTITWVALHRFHHATSDKPNDPHSPYIHREKFETLEFSYWQAFKSWIGLWDVKHIPPNYAKDLMRDPFHVFIHRHYFKLIFMYVLIMAMIDPWLVIYGYALPATLTLHASSTVSVIAHYHGYRTYQTGDKSTNSWLVALITFGDGWHNNHHAQPSNWMFGQKWWELDLSGQFIKLIKTKS